MDKSLIKRQDAIDALDVPCQEHRYKIPGKRETYSSYNEAWQDALDRAESAIGNLPSAEPERREGKWERHYCEDGNPDGWQCDCCGEWFYFGDMKPNFCPDCGADMRGNASEDT